VPQAVTSTVARTLRSARELRVFTSGERAAAVLFVPSDHADSAERVAFAAALKQAPIEADVRTVG
jgi:hypothetical protein